MVDSLVSLLKEKRSEDDFENYYRRSQSKCQELGISEQSLKHRRVLARIDDAPHTQHHSQITPLTESVN